MQQVGTISFVDVDSGDEGAVIVRATAGRLGLCITSRKNGDLEAFLGRAESQAVLEALQQAISVVQGRGEQPATQS